MCKGVKIRLIIWNYIDNDSLYFLMLSNVGSKLYFNGLCEQPNSLSDWGRLSRPINWLQLQYNSISDCGRLFRLVNLL